MDSWEKVVKSEVKKKQRQVMISYSPEKQWVDAVRKEKERARKEFYRPIQTGFLHRQGDEEERNIKIYGKGTVDDDDIMCEGHTVQPKAEEEIHCTNKTFFQPSMKKTAISDVPPLCECAKRLKEKVRIINVENRLYYFSEPCYHALDRIKLMQFYRDNVDRNLYGAKNVKSFYELYSYLLTDSEIQIKPNLDRLSR